MDGIEDEPGGALTLVATERPSDLTSREDVDRLATIIAALDLAEIASAN